MRLGAGHRWLLASSLFASAGLLPWALSALEVVNSRQYRPFAFLLGSREPGARLRLLRCTQRQAWNDDSPPPPPPRPPRLDLGTFRAEARCFSM
eukprot:g21307.t1